MQLNLVMTSQQRSSLLRHLNSTQVEERFAALLIGTSTTASSTTLYCHRVIQFTDPALVDYSCGVRLSPKGIVSMFNAANSAGTGVIEVHSHPGATDHVSFSPTDEQGFAKILQFAISSLKPGRPYGSVVVGSNSMSGCAWLPPNGKRIDIDRFFVCDDMDTLHRAHSMTPVLIDELRLTRQISAIGTEGQRRLSRLVVAIVGVGGIGSIIARTLAYEGVTTFILIDPDFVQYSNLNRLDGATPWDAFCRRKKVSVLRREIRRINRKCNVRKIARSAYSATALDALLDAHLIIGCTDNHASRIYLNEVSAAFLKLYIDVGTGIFAPNHQICEAGGRVTIVTPGDGCLLCARAVNPTIAGFELSSEDEKDFARQRGYMEGADVPAPSVMSLNQTLASMAVTELKALVTGIRKPTRQIFYDMLTAQAAPCKFKVGKSCPVCHSFLGKADSQGISQRHSRIV